MVVVVVVALERPIARPSPTPTFFTPVISSCFITSPTRVDWTLDRVIYFFLPDTYEYISCPCRPHRRWG